MSSRVRRGSGLSGLLRVRSFRSMTRNNWWAWCLAATVAGCGGNGGGDPGGARGEASATSAPDVERVEDGGLHHRDPPSPAVPFSYTEVPACIPTHPVGVKHPAACTEKLSGPDGRLWKETRFDRAGRPTFERSTERAGKEVYWKYDAQGRLDSYGWCDGEEVCLDQTMRYEGPHLVEATASWSSDPFLGPYRETVSYTWSPAGHLTREERRIEAKGVNRSSGKVYIRLPDNRLSAVEVYKDGWQLAEAIRYAYDAQDRLTTVTTNGVVTEAYAYFDGTDVVARAFLSAWGEEKETWFNAQGQILAESIRRGGAVRQRSAFTYSPDGTVERRVRDTSEIGTHWTYERKVLVDGRPALTWLVVDFRGLDGDRQRGRHATRDRFTCDGEPVLHEVDWDQDGQADHIRRWVYDAAGNLLRVEVLDGASNLLMQTDYTYECHAP